MKITLKEIAKMAGVSITTVSRVINDNAIGNMSKDKYDRICEIIAMTGYAPDPMATALRSGVSKAIGVILPSSINPYYSQLSHYIENEAYKKEHLIFVCNSNSDVAREKKYIFTLKKYKVSGILLCSTGLSSHDIDELHDETIKLVLLDEEVEGYGGDTVLGNDFLGGYKAAEYLYSLNHEKIVVILGPEKLASKTNRLNGFLSYFSEIGVEYDRNLLVQGDFTIRSGYEGIQSIIDSKKSFTAVFSHNDLMAIGAIQALSENRINVPEEISVLGYDNIFLDQYFSPTISTIATPREELAKIAVSRVMQGKKGDNSDLGIVLVEPVLIERQSCKKI